MAPTFAPGDSVALIENYSAYTAGSFGHVIDVEPKGDVYEDDLLYVTLTDGRTINGIFARRVAPGIFETGDRVAIESNVYGAMGELWTAKAAQVGDTGTVTSEADADGDVYVRLDRTGHSVPIQTSGLVYLGETEPTDEEVAEQEALDEAPSAADLIAGLESILNPVADAEEAEDDEDEDDYYPEDLSRRADALALAYDVLIDAAAKAHEAGMDSEVDHDVAKDLATFILGEEGDE